MAPGVKHLSPHLRELKALLDNLSRLSGSTLGVDISGFIFKLIRKIAFTRDFHQIPPIDLSIHVEDYFL